MKKIVNIFILLSFILFGCTNQEVNEETSTEVIEEVEDNSLSPLSVDGIHLVDENNQIIQLKE